MRQITDDDLGLNDYQRAAMKTGTYPNKGNNIFYPLIGLAGEVGEVSEKIKKLWRDKNITLNKDISEPDKQALIKELGDVLWYVAALAYELGIPLAAIANLNIEKLHSRFDRNVIKGSGDNR